MIPRPAAFWMATPPRPESLLQGSLLSATGQPDCSPWPASPEDPRWITAPGLQLRHWRGWLSPADALMAPRPGSQALQQHLLRAIPWQQPAVRVYGRLHPVPRLVCWLGDPGATYAYSGLEHHPEPWTDPLERLRQQLQAFLGCRFNSLLLNRYRHGLDRMGWHADDEPELPADQPIASLSLGVSRCLRFRPHPSPPAGHHSQAEGSGPLNLELADGDLLVMDPPTQQHWQHELPVRRRIQAERINLTFRWVQGR